MTQTQIAPDLKDHRQGRNWGYQKILFLRLFKEWVELAGLERTLQVRGPGTHVEGSTWNRGLREGSAVEPGRTLQWISYSAS